MKKYHYAEIISHANESDPHDEWSDVLCKREGDDPDVTSVIENVTCKHCLKIIKKILEQELKNRTI